MEQLSIFDDVGTRHAAPASPTRVPHGMELRPYQTEAYNAILGEWDKGVNRTLLVLVTGGGKTIIFAKVIEELVRRGKRVLVLAHRGELLEQAADKLHMATGLGCATEKAEESCKGSWYRVVVGSVQSLQREKRLNQFPPDYFDAIVVDEAHHVLADGYMRILEHFSEALVLGVTATPDRGDMRNLGSVFETLAYEYTLPRAIREGYLCPIKALTIPLKLDISGVGMSSGDYALSGLGSALEPYLEQIAEEMAKVCLAEGERREPRAEDSAERTRKPEAYAQAGTAQGVSRTRKTVIFLPLIATSKRMCDILTRHGFRAAEVNGQSTDREAVLAAFDRGEYNVLCNSMLLTEGWDCPSVDCIVVLRPTKIRSLYAQMVGRGTRLNEGKEHLLILDFLWHTERHELCHPAHLICDSDEVAAKMTENLEAVGCPMDIEAAEKQAAGDVVAQREEALAKTLAEMRHRKRKLVDPLQFEMSIQAEDLAGYVPVFGYQMAPPSEGQKAALEKAGILPDDIDNAGKASLLLDKLTKRREEGLTTPKQIRFLESRNFLHVGTWKFDEARRLIDRIAGNGWKIPSGIVPQTYNPKGDLQ